MGSRKKAFGFLIIGALFLLAPFAFILVSGDSGLFSLKQKKVTCDVTVKNPLLKDVRIEDVDCRASPSSIFTFSTFSIFGKTIGRLFPDEIGLTFYSGGKSDFAKKKIGETQTLVISTSLTVGEEVDSGVIQLLKEDIIIQQKNVNF